MSVTDLAREAARRFCVVLVSPESVEEALAYHDAPAAWRDRAHVEALTELVRQAVGAALVEHHTVAELWGLARFHATAEGLSIARKSFAYTTALTSRLQAELAAWAASQSQVAPPQESPGPR